MDQRDPSNEKRRALEGILGSPPKADQSELPDSYRPIGIGTTFEPPPKRRNLSTVILVAAVIVIIGLFAAFLIIARDQILSLIGVIDGGSAVERRSELPGGAESSRPEPAGRAEGLIALENLRNANSSLERRLQEMEAENDQLRGDIALLTEEVERFKAEIPSETAVESSQQLSQRISELETQLDEAKGLADRMSRDNGTLRSQMDRQSRAFELQLEQLRTNNGRLQDQIDSLKRDLSASESELRTLKSSHDRNISASEQLDQVNREYRRVLSLLQDAQTSNRSKDARIEELQEESEILRRRASSLTETTQLGAETGQVRDSGGPVEPGTPGVTNPVPIKTVRPSYPLSAMQRRVSGIVRIRVLVSEHGDVLETEVLSSPDPLGALDRAALEAAKRWKFDPARRDGSPVQIWYVIPMQFKL